MEQQPRDYQLDITFTASELSSVIAALADRAERMEQVALKQRKPKDREDWLTTSRKTMALATKLAERLRDLGWDTSGLF